MSEIHWRSHVQSVYSNKKILEYNVYRYRFYSMYTAIYAYYQSEHKYENIIIHYNDVCGRINHLPPWCKITLIRCQIIWFRLLNINRFSRVVVYMMNEICDLYPFDVCYYICILCCLCLWRIIVHVTHSILTIQHSIVEF